MLNNLISPFRHSPDKPAANLLTFFHIIKWLALPIIIMLACYGVKLDGVMEPGDAKRVLGHDFINLWTAARLALDGQVNILFNPDLFHRAQEQFFTHPLLMHNWSYPPHLIPWILWLGLLPYPVALGLWLGMTFALYVWATCRAVPSNQKLLLVIALIIAPSGIENIISGQNGFLTAACLIGGVWQLSRRPILAGILLGFLTFKPQLGILLPVALISGRHWRTLVATSLTSMALCLFSILLFGLGPWIIFIVSTLPYQELLMENNSFFHDYLVSPFASLLILGASMPVAYAAQITISILAAFIVGYCFYRPMPEWQKNAVFIAATFLSMPYICCYDMTALSAAILLTLPKIRMKLPELSLILLLWILPVAVYQINGAGFPIMPLFIAGFLYIILRQKPDSVSALTAA